MKKSFKIFAVLFIVCLLGITIVKSIVNTAVEKSTTKIALENKLLWNYYNSTENLLDSIFVRYPWADAMDNYEYYDAVEEMYNNNLLVE